MRKLFTMMTLAVMALCLTACSDKDDEVKLADLTIQLTGISDLSGFNVVLTNATTAASYTGTTTATGSVVFQVTPGVYNATVSEIRYAEGYRYVYNGVASNITLTADKGATATIELKEAKTSQVIIKELYNGGVLKDDGKSKFQYDKCVILYNNTDVKASITNLGFGMVAPANSYANNKNYGTDGKLSYESAGFTPSWNGICYYEGTIDIEPYSQVVINIHGAIDNTQTVSNSVNYANADYYCIYDPESGYNNTGYYPTPASVIPTSHYLKAVRVGLGNAWALSVGAPALFVFQAPDTNLNQYANNAENIWYDGGEEGSTVWACVKITNDWIFDGIEVFSNAYDDNLKRLTSDIDAGSVGLTNYLGHSLYRNVDKAATEALAENAGKLVYNYSLGVDKSTDPSGIDAEASIKNGAHIIYMDTNNSTADFHERQKCSLRN